MSSTSLVDSRPFPFGAFALHVETNSHAGRYFTELAQALTEETDDAPRDFFEEPLQSSISNTSERFQFHLKRLLYTILPFAKNTLAIRQTVQWHLEDSPQDRLYFGIYLGDLEMVQAALSVGAEINKPLYRNISPLLLACKKGNSTLVLYLLMQGAQAQVVGGSHDHQTPLSEALLRADLLKDCLPALRAADQGFTEEFLQRKWLAHEFEVTGFVHLSSLGNCQFKRLGYRLRQILVDYVQHPYFQNLEIQLRRGKGPDLNLLNHELATPLTQGQCQQIEGTLKEMREAMQSCLDCEVNELYIHPYRIVQNTIARLEKGKPAICFGLTRCAKENYNALHAWGLVISKEHDHYVAQLCNRGRGSGNYPGILIKKMNQIETYVLIASYAEALNWKCSDPRLGPRILKKITEQFTTGEYQHLKSPHQIVGNCCNASQKLIEKAYLTSEFSKILGDPEQGQQLYSGFVNGREKAMQMQKLQNYCSTSTHRDMALLSALLVKGIFQKRLRPLLQNHFQLCGIEHPSAFQQSTGLPYLYSIDLLYGRRRSNVELKTCPSSTIEETILWLLDHYEETESNATLLQNIIRHPTCQRRFPNFQNTLIKKIQEFPISTHHPLMQVADHRFRYLIDLNAICPALVFDLIGTLVIHQPKTVGLIKDLLPLNFDFNQRDARKRTALIRAASLVFEEVNQREKRLKELEMQLPPAHSVQKYSREELCLIDHIREEKRKLAISIDLFTHKEGQLLQTKLCQLLLEMGVDKNCVDSEGFSAADYALRDNNLDLHNLLT